MPSDTNNTVTRSHLVDAIYKEIGLTRSEATQIFDLVLEAVGAVLKENGEIKIQDFGHFTIKQKAERLGRNPKTGEEVNIPAHNAISFKAIQYLKNTIDNQEMKNAA